MTYDGSRAFSDSGTSVWYRTGHAPRRRVHESSVAASELLPSEWLENFWTETRNQAREASWAALPDRIGDAAERGEGVTSADIAFLRDRSADRSGTIASATAALRALGRLCEDEPRWLDEAAIAFKHGLRDPVAGIRYAAAESVWQARAMRVIPEVGDALRIERDPTVRATLEHVRRILR